MFEVLGHRIYRHLFLAQVIALVGTGLATVALSLLAYDLAGERAGAVLGTALAIKMVAYIGLSPIAGALANSVPRKALLVAMDAVRAVIALCLPFVTEIWQVYVLIFLLQSASAIFTPTFQATIPDVLPEEEDYTRALSLSRLAYDMESLTSPILAAALLSVISFHWLFSGTVVGFVASALLVVTTVLPRPASSPNRGGFFDKMTSGARIYLATPRLRGLLALSLSSAAAGSMVIVNSVVIVRGLGLSQRDVALSSAVFGTGSIIAALTLPRLLKHVSDRRLMTCAAGVTAVILAAMGVATTVLMGQPIYWPLLLAAWLLLGFCYSLCVTPSGRLLRRSAHAEDRPALFAAQFGLSHACWLVCYPLAGQLGAATGMATTFVVMGAIAGAGMIAAARFWPVRDPECVPHRHDDLAPDHEHQRLHAKGNHPFVIDRLHPKWPNG